MRRKLSLFYVASEIFLRIELEGHSGRFKLLRRFQRLRLSLISAKISRVTL
jgi:hypothetical protein